MSEWWLDAMLDSDIDLDPRQFPRVFVSLVGRDGNPTPVYYELAGKVVKSLGTNPRNPRLLCWPAIGKAAAGVYLKRGEIEKALTYIHPHNREKYREIFRILKDKMPAIVEGDIELVMEDIGEGVATYRLRRLEKNGERFAYSVTFALDMGGNWKILDE